MALLIFAIGINGIRDIERDVGYSDLSVLCISFTRNNTVSPEREYRVSECDSELCKMYRNYSTPSSTIDCLQTQFF